MATYYNVTVETTNGSKFYKMEDYDFASMLEDLEQGQKKYIRIPGTRVYMNTDQIVYVWYRELSNEETL